MYTETFYTLLTFCTKSKYIERISALRLLQSKFIMVCLGTHNTKWLKRSMKCFSANIICMNWEMDCILLRMILTFLTIFVFLYNRSRIYSVAKSN